jgi:hypothetical protein
VRAVDEDGDGGSAMRVCREIEIGRTTCRALFDTEARNTYVTPSAARLLPTSKTPATIRATIGGKVYETNTTAILDARIDEHPVSTLAWVVDEIGRDQNGAAIEVLFGTLAMRQWGVRVIPDEQRLDLTHYPDVFVEF